MLCKANLIGRIVNELSLEDSKNNNKYIRFSIACNYTTQGVQKTCFLNCVSFGVTAENLYKYCGKGSLIYIDGTITQNTYVNKQNVKISSYTIMCQQIRFLQSRNSRTSGRSFESTKNKNTHGEKLTSFGAPKDEQTFQKTVTELQKSMQNQSSETVAKNSSAKDINFADDIDWGEN